MNKTFLLAVKYLQETLSTNIRHNKKWPGHVLPYFLQDAWELQEIELFGTTVLLAQNRSTAKRSLADIAAQIGRIRTLAGHPAIYLTSALASYERKRLIQQHVPFLVPGNQMYLPDLGLDLREHFRRKVESTGQPPSPSTQALLVAAMLRRDWGAQWEPSEWAAHLGYTAMTISRCIRELAAMGLAEIHHRGRSQSFSMNHSVRETWGLAASRLRSPVKRIVYTTRLGFGEAIDMQWRWAGLSALAEHTMLAEPRIPVRAISATIWSSTGAHVEELREAEPGGIEWQLWSYSPTLKDSSQSVDPFSLILSLRESADERVQSALEELQEQLAW